MPEFTPRDNEIYHCRRMTIGARSPPKKLIQADRKDTFLPYAMAVPISLPHPAMVDADWADSFAITIDDPDITPERAAQKIMDGRPVWMGYLLALRNAMVRPLGLKTAPEPDADVIGLFPVIERGDDFIVLGMDDRHLDFRLTVEVEKFQCGQTVIRSSTLIRRHNMLGRMYLGTIMPFHKAIVPAMLNGAFASR
ncbi:Protein of unknown function [Thalassospira xiamenensis]|uniref:DUF2867 domain-containing protein n=1 Tax=Thalassospira xiamenensis TaxID=220697 RepID=A0A285RTK1_9PROT|nr:Protein of unknown function [Thalassospira xiamenensis]